MKNICFSWLFQTCNTKIESIIIDFKRKNKNWITEQNWKRWTCALILKHKANFYNIHNWKWVTLLHYALNLFWEHESSVFLYKFFVAWSYAKYRFFKAISIHKIMILTKYLVLNNLIDNFLVVTFFFWFQKKRHAGGPAKRKINLVWPRTVKQKLKRKMFWFMTYLTLFLWTKTNVVKLVNVSFKYQNFNYFDVAIHTEKDVNLKF